MEDEMFYDVMSGRYFIDNVSHIDAAARELERRCPSELPITLNDFYRELANDQLAPIPLGEEAVFRLDYVSPRMIGVHDNSFKLLYVVLDWDYRPSIKWNLT